MWGLNLMSPCCLHFQTPSPTFDFILSAVSTSFFFFFTLWGKRESRYLCGVCACFGWVFACVCVHMWRGMYIDWRLPSDIVLDRFPLLFTQTWSLTEPWLHRLTFAPLCWDCNWVTPICLLSRGFWSHKLQFSCFCARALATEPSPEFPFNTSLPYNLFYTKKPRGSLNPRAKMASLCSKHEIQQLRKSSSLSSACFSSR